MAVWFVQPVDAQAILQVSGSSRDINGPAEPSRSRMPRRQASFACTQARMDSCHGPSSPRPGHSAISARKSTMSSLDRTRAWSSNSVRLARSLARSRGE